MFFSDFQYQLGFSDNQFRINTMKERAKIISLLILSATFGTYSSAQATNFSSNWTGSFFANDNWTDANWNFDPVYNGTFPNNNGDTFDVNLSRGTVTLNQDISINAFTMDGGTLTGAHNLDINKPFNWTRGNLSGTGSVNAKGGLELSGGRKVMSKEQKLVNSQAANWTAGSIDLFNASQLINAPGATFNVTQGGLRMFGSSNARFINDGNVVINLSETSQNVQFDGPQFNNNGIVKVEAGTARFGGGGTSSGLFEIAENGRLNFSGGSHTLLANSSIIGSNVEFNFKDSGGRTAIEGNYNVGNTSITGNTAIFNAVQSFTGTLNQSGGFLDGTGDVIVTGKTTLSGGVIQSTRPNTQPQAVLAAVGGLEINGNFLTIVGNRRVLNVGVANWTSGGIGLNSTLTRFENAQSGTFNITGTASKIQGQGSLLGGTGEKGLFVNRGNVVVDLSDDSRPVQIETSFANLGNIKLQGNKLVLGENLLQFPTGALLFDIGGAGDGEFDFLHVGVNAILEGIIDITLVDPEGGSNTYNPIVGETFDILTASSIFDANGGQNYNFILGGQDGDKFEHDVVVLDSGRQALRLTSIAAIPSEVPLPASLWLFLSALFSIRCIGTKRP